MIINFLVPHVFISGGVRRIFTLGDLLQKRGHSVTIISPIKKKPSWFKLSCKLKYVPEFKEEGIPDADAIVCPVDGPGEAVLNYSHNKGNKYLLVLHHGYHDLPKEIFNIKSNFIKLSTTSWLLDVCQRLDPEGEAYKISFGIDKTLFHPIDGLRSKRYKTVGIMYHPYDWKGFKDGREAIEMVLEKHPNTRICIFGCHGKPDVNFKFKFYKNPPQKKLKKMYSKFDIFICSSWKEGLGSPSIEAMACKSGLVTTDNGGSTDYAINEETALVSPPQNPQALAENVIRLLEDEALLERISESGCKHINTFTWDRCIDIVEDIFKKELEY